MQDLPPSYLKKIYKKFISNSFSIVRLEYCLTGSYIKQIIKKTGDVRYEQFSYLINCLNNFADLFLLSSATWEPEIISDDAKYHLLPIVSDAKTKIINGAYKSMPPIIEEDENLMEKVKIQKERQLNGYCTGISNIYYNSGDYTKNADERIKLLQDSMANLSRLMETGQEIIKELRDK
ncbi:hypothetical protein GTA51_04815 [Desulfovibrio aerotolerans]|uniref:Uncharacterized protein n=1 Tax=Solidesulfovibrio aerotolerans TaxID=295255 RepID=A0A7C9ITI0_9BACT|nr:hypothetical protein [Solidesulfovibrio aerotolerans]MYL82460.1 hypothetical protein [Solidesulfovibrio aerotolerans]